MTETQHPYDEARNLDSHFKKLENTNGKQAGDCFKCAALMCSVNITPLALVRALGENPMTDEVEQFTCKDQEDDPNVPANLGKIEAYE